jgi:hypothetical protein
MLFLCCGLDRVSDMDFTWRGTAHFSMACVAATPAGRWVYFLRASTVVSVPPSPAKTPPRSQNVCDGMTRCANQVQCGGYCTRSSRYSGALAPTEAAKDRFNGA